ncbi:hypothetical protein DFH09DRAFT_1456233 [Mycena vulgaris]|nr:hypothetical protein DFH09DRAFT_1456233 [Mycena vulgaris]
MVFSRSEHLARHIRGLRHAVFPRAYSSRTLVFPPNSNPSVLLPPFPTLLLLPFANSHATPRRPSSLPSLLPAAHRALRLPPLHSTLHSLPASLLTRPSLSPRPYSHLPHLLPPRFSRLDSLRQHVQTVHADKADLNEAMMRELTSLHASMGGPPSTTTTSTTTAIAGTGTASPMTPTSASGGAGKRRGAATKRTRGSGSAAGVAAGGSGSMTGITAIVGCRASSSSRSLLSDGELSVVHSIDADSTGLVSLVCDVPSDESLLLALRCLLSPSPPILPSPPSHAPSWSVPLRIRAPVHPVKPHPLLLAHLVHHIRQRHLRRAHHRVQRSPRFGRR